ncbi:TPR repeat-containing thioredoxin TTL1-like [Solanum tuberosum]|uniref:TPR repeat-containing thioredoxin TTL1-like n=1 Tax=Solanum tuberosum TaxID=4113 RepID=UPI0003D28A74|nr:PREDICTED: TPR repeat-containing thioredoxin TTL1-like [Solanum tuberosum]
MGSTTPLADRMKNSLRFDEAKRHDDPRILKLGSTLRTRMSCSTTGSSGRSVSSSDTRKSGSGSGSSSSRVEIVPAGNICPSGKVITGMRSKPVRTVLSDNEMIPGMYGYGSIMPAGATPRARRVSGSGSPESSWKINSEELKVKGNENYKKGNFLEALYFYDKAIAISPGDGRLHCNRAAALMGLKRITEAVKECEEAIRLAPTYVRAHQRLGSLLLILGQVENARKCLFSLDQIPEEAELHKLETVENHINKCSEARRLGDWTSVLKEAEAATSRGAEASAQLFACQAEAHLKLHQLTDAELWMYKARMYEASARAYKSKLFGMISEAYIFFVQAQIENTLGKFDNACAAIERAAQVDLQSAEVIGLLKNMRLVGRARSLGNELFKSGRYIEACSAYGEGLSRDSLNLILYCNRATCWYKLEQWEKSLDDCNHALLIQPHYTKALFQKAASNVKLERWADAVRDYEILRQELPNDRELAEFLFHCRVELKKSQGEDVHNMTFVRKVDLVLDLDKFHTAITSYATSVILFKEASNEQCKQMSLVMDTLSTKYRSVSFLEVDVEQSPAIAAAENITTLPTFKMYRYGRLVMELYIPNPKVLEDLIRHYRH